jgi:hypothetical protein
MNAKLDWIADVDSSKVSVLKIVQIISAKKPGNYILGRGKSDDKENVVGIYLGDTVFPEDRPVQSCIVGYVDP